MWSVAIFAYNESKNIGRCLQSLEAVSGNITAYVLINGCTDDTEAVVRRIAKDKPWVVPVSIAIGDKCNAWNHYVHEIRQSSEMHVFLDGDCYVYKDSLHALAKTLAEHPDAYAAAGFPATGRSRREWAIQLSQSSLSGNLYALSDAAVVKMRNEKIYLPKNFVGDDSLLNYLLLTDFQAGKNDRHHERIVAATQAKFGFDPLSPWRPSDYVKHFKRSVRYSVRHYQCEVLIQRLKREGMSIMPHCIDDMIDADVLKTLKVRKGAVGVFDYMALRRMRSACAGEKEVFHEMESS